jgi:cell wall-associated NlpC family hydrolase
MRKCLFLAVLFFAAISSQLTHAQDSSPSEKPGTTTVVTPRGSHQAVYSESTAPSATAKVFYDAVDQAGNLVISALSYMGINYKYGGNEPDAGFDCSGFVRYVYNNTLGLILPRTSAEMSKKGDTVRKDDLKPGDLVFFNTLKRAFSHVGIYVGEGKFVHAPSSGGVVRVESMEIPYWQQRFNGARRLDTNTLAPTLQPASVSSSQKADIPKADALDKLVQDIYNKAN